MPTLPILVDIVTGSMSTVVVGIAVAAIAFGLAGFITGALALRTLARLRQSVALLSRGSGRETILEVADKHIAASVAVRHDVAELQTELRADQQAAEQRMATERAELGARMDSLGESLRTVLRRVALVRYDAFDEMGGRLSFSLAFLDDNGDGLTLTSITSPTETRLYAKSLAKGIGEHALSPEEQQAVSAALAR